MKFIIKCALLLMPALVLATPAFAICRDAQCLYDSQEPGSVIVFPKFIKGAVAVDGVGKAQTEIEVRARCPIGWSPPALGAAGTHADGGAIGTPTTLTSTVGRATSAAEGTARARSIKNSAAALV